MDHRAELRTIVELARTGTARRAADTLGVSQSTVTDVVARVERAYGTRLFDRGRRGSKPTASGELVVAAAQQALAILDNVKREVDLLEGFGRGSLSIGSHPMLVESHLVPALASVLSSDSQLRCRIRPGEPGELVEWLQRQELEFFIGTRVDRSTDDVDIEIIDIDQPIAFCRSDHPLVGAPPIGREALLDYPFITANRQIQDHDQTDEVHIDDELLAGLVARGQSVQVADLSTMKQLVSASHSIGVASRRSMASFLQSGEYAELHPPASQEALLAPEDIVLVTLRDRPLPPSALAVIDAVRRISAEQTPSLDV